MSIALALLTAPIGGIFLRNKLKAMVAAKLNGQLDTGTVLYVPPYGLVVWNASLKTKGPQGKDVNLIEVNRLDLKLAELPKKGKPLVFQSLRFDEPTVHFIKAKNEFVGQSGMVVEQPKDQKPEQQAKVSDMFRLRHAQINGGRIVYEDLNHDGAGAMNWRGINVNLETVPQSPSAYTFDLQAKNARVLELALTGKFDIDSLVLDAQKLQLLAKADDNGTDNPLPPQVQELLKKYGVAGELTIDGNGSANLKQMEKGTFAVTVELKNGKAQAPQWEAGVDRLALKIDVEKKQPQDPLTAEVKAFEADSGPVKLVLSKAGAFADSTNNRWEAKVSGFIAGAAKGATLPAKSRSMVEKINPNGRLEFTAAASGALAPNDKHGGLSTYEGLVYARDVDFQPPNFAMPFTQISGGPIRLASGVVTAENLIGFYDRDQWVASSARVPLDGIKKEIHINDIAGTVIFDRRSSPYPQSFGKVVSELRPSGPFNLSGSVTVRSKEHDPRTQYSLNVSSDKGSALISELLLPLSEIRGDASIQRDLVDLSNLTAQTLGGELTAKGKIQTRDPLIYEGELSARNVDLEKLASLYQALGKSSSKLKGRAFLNLKFVGDGKGTSGLSGSGEMEVIDGDFWEFPVFQDIQKHAKVAREALTASQAAATFEFAQRKVKLKNSAVSAPVLGLQGTGSITFNGDLNLRVVAAPLADWKDKLKQTGIPIVSNVVGEFVGAIQGILNTATKTLLYEFKVTGPASEPKVETIPVPVLSLPAASAFQTMMKEAKDSKLIDAIREKQEKK